MFEYKVKIRKVSGVLTESVLPNKNLVVKSKSKLDENTLYDKVANFYEQKYGLVVEEFSVSGFDNEEPSNVTTGNTQGGASFNKPTAKRRGRPVGSKGKSVEAAPKRQKAQYFVANWGYEQTNIDFYKVLKMTETSVTLIKVKEERRENGNHWGHYTAVPTDEIEEGAKPFRRKLTYYGGKPGCRIESYMFADLWDGKPQHGTNYA